MTAEPNHEHAVEPPRAESLHQRHAAKPLLLLAIAAVVSGIVLAIGAFTNQPQFAFSYLFAVIFFFTLSVGSLFWLHAHYATDAEWTVIVRRLLETKAILLPAFFVLFLPLLWSANLLWPALNSAPGADHVVDLKRGWLNFPFSWFDAGYAEKWHQFALLGWSTRAVIYLGILSWLAWMFYRHSTRQDETGAARHTIIMRYVGQGGLPFFALALTYASFDWLMALDKHWYSTLWGVYVFAGGVGSAMCVLLLTTRWMQHLGYMKLANVEHYHVMGKFILAFCAFWTYCAFCQYMLIWYSNIPEETSYFLRRNVGSWNTLNWILVIGRFFIAFPILLTQWVKRNPKYLTIAAVYLLVMQAIDVYIIVLPMLHEEGVSVSIYDFAALLFVGSVLGLLFVRLLTKKSLYPVRDPRMVESIHMLN